MLKYHFLSDILPRNTVKLRSYTIIAPIRPTISTNAKKWIIPEFSVGIGK